MNNAFQAAGTSDDIDLLMLIERALIFLRKYKWLFLIAALLGAGLGIWGWSSSPKVYKSRLILQPSIITSQNYIQVIDNWNTDLKNKDYSSLASQLGCAEDLLRGVKKMKGSEIQKIFTPNNPSGFYIEVVVKDIELLPDLQLAIIQGLNNIDFVKRQITIKKENIKQMIEQVQVEMKRLDSTKTKVEGILDKNESRSSSLMLDVSGLNGQLINMNEKLLGYKSELQFLAPVQVLDGFSKNNNPTGPSLFVWLGLGLFTCLALAYLFALFSSVNAKLKARKTGMQNG